MEAQAILQRLAGQPYSEHPFLSLCLDWTPDGNGQRQAPRIVDQELNRIADELDLHGNARQHFEADRQRITEYLDREAPADARSLAIFACAPDGVWEALPLQARMETVIAVDHYPHLFGLARVLDDYETYAVVLADGQESRIIVVGLDDIRPVAETQAPEKIKRFDQGGQAQMLFQRRTDNLIKAHTKDITAELGQVIECHDVRHVIIAGNDAIKGMVLEALTEPIKARLVDYINFDPNANMQELRETLVPIMEQVEQKQEAAALAELQEQHYADGLGIAGVADTALALSKGQVNMLLMRRDFAGDGGECPNCGMLRAGRRDKCPYDGTELRPVELREAFVARAIQQSAVIEILESDDYLAQYEGVGALLRYRETERTA